MKVDTMRKVDYFIGIPLCLLLSIVNFPFRFFRRKTQKPQNVLFIELSEMGSAILVDPAIQKLKDKIDGEVFFVIFKRNLASLFILNSIPNDNIFTICENGLLGLVSDSLKFLFWCRKKKIDSVIDLELFSRFTALLTFLSGAGNRVGFFSFHNEGLYRGRLLTHEILYNNYLHIAKNFVGMVNALTSDKSEIPYSKTKVRDGEIKLRQVPISTNDLEKVKAILTTIFRGEFSGRKIILINPNASELLIQRRWMPEYYLELIKTILTYEKESLVLITGSFSEREEAEELLKSVDNKRCFNGAGKFQLHELIPLYSLSHLMVTNDSGPGHFSAVTGLPVFVIFGPETPALYGSLGNSLPIYAGLSCSPCVSAANHRKTSCTNNVCLQVIKPEDVFKALKDALDSEVWINIR